MNIASLAVESTFVGIESTFVVWSSQVLAFGVYEHSFFFTR